MLAELNRWLAAVKNLRHPRLGLSFDDLFPLHPDRLPLLLWPRPGVWMSQSK
jgi:hypothetical protein